MKIKRVILLCDFFSSLGGTEYYNYLLAKSLCENQIEVNIYIGERPRYDFWLKELEKLSIKYYYPKEYTRDKNDRSVINTYMKEIESQMIKWKPDIIHANPPGKMLVSLFENEMAIGCPIIATEWTMPSENTAYWYPVELREYINKIDVMIATCSKLVEGIRYYHNFGGRIEIVPHLINRPMINKQATDANSLYSVGCISRLSQEKGLVFLLGAWARIVEEFPQATLHIYGHGEELKYLEGLIEALGIGRSVFLEGVYQPIVGIDDIVYKHQIYVQPSLFESIPTSIIELMGRGRAIIATDVGGVSEVINEQMESGLLISRASTDDIYVALKKLFTDKLLREKIQHNAMILFEKKYDLYSCMDKIISIYNSLIKE